MHENALYDIDNVTLLLESVQQDRAEIRRMNDGDAVYLGELHKRLGKQAESIDHTLDDLQRQLLEVQRRMRLNEADLEAVQRDILTVEGLLERADDA